MSDEEIAGDECIKGNICASHQSKLAMLCCITQAKGHRDSLMEKFYLAVVTCIWFLCIFPTFFLTASADGLSSSVWKSTLNFRGTPGCAKHTSREGHSIPSVTLPLFGEPANADRKQHPPLPPPSTSTLPADNCTG